MRTVDAPEAERVLFSVHARPTARGVNVDETNSTVNRPRVRGRTTMPREMPQVRDDERSRPCRAMIFNNTHDAVAIIGVIVCRARAMSSPRRADTGETPVRIHCDSFESSCLQARTVRGRRCCDDVAFVSARDGGRSAAQRVRGVE